MKLKKQAKKGYIHGFDPKEQRRLIHQASYLESHVMPGIDFDSRGSGRLKILEVGCGVGAQSKILLRLFPQISIDAVDLSEAQLATAGRYLRRELKEKRVELIHSDATELVSNLSRRRYDGAFLCWFLEHVPDPEKVLRQVHRLLKPGAKVYTTEVTNQTFFVFPQSPKLMEVWRKFNDQQLELSGDPFVGMKVAGLLRAVGFRKIHSEVRELHFDRRDRRKLKVFCNYFERLVLSGVPSLISSGRLKRSDVRALRSEFNVLRRDPSAVMFLGFVRAQAVR